MKTILYIIALVAMAVAGFFAYSNIEPHQEQLTLTTELERNNVQIRSQIKGVNGKISAQKKEKIAEQENKDTLEGEIELAVEKTRKLAQQSEELNGSLDGLKEEKANIDRLKLAVEEAAGGVGKSIAEIPEYFEEIEDKKKQLNKTQNSLLQEVERVANDVNSKKNEVLALNSAAQQRRKNLKANGVSSLITSVDNDWGFVIVKPHSDAIINQDSQLIVVRGDRHVGRLSINAIESGRVLANIDYNSLVSGMRIRPGDKVILGKVVTR